MTAFHNLHYLVPTKFTTKKKTWTPTIVHSKDAFLIMVNHSNSITDAMKKENDVSVDLGIADHPIVIEVNNNESVEYFVQQRIHPQISLKL